MNSLSMSCDQLNNNELYLCTARYRVCYDEKSVLKVLCKAYTKVLSRCSSVVVPYLMINIKYIAVNSNTYYIIMINIIF